MKNRKHSSSYTGACLYIYSIIVILRMKLSRLLDKFLI